MSMMLLSIMLASSVLMDLEDDDDDDEEEVGAISIVPDPLLSKKAMRSFACAIDSVNAALASFSSRYLETQKQDGKLIV